jgi:hypothetical protein
MRASAVQPRLRQPRGRHAQQLGEMYGVQPGIKLIGLGRDTHGPLPLLSWRADERDRRDVGPRAVMAIT